tara:strand:- start:53 stop:592 length:540 start_codon:yes stop_codon:yes gene_type:complete
MALKIGDAENFQVKEENKRLRNLIPQIVNSLMIGGGGNRPGEDGPYRPPNPDEVPGVPPGYPNIPKMLAHSPSGLYGYQGRPLDEGDIPWRGFDPSGNQIEIPWIKEQYDLDKPRREQLHQLKYHPETLQANAGDLMIQGLPRGGRYGNSHRPARQSGDLTDDKLIETLKMAGPLLRGV